MFIINQQRDEAHTCHTNEAHDISMKPKIEQEFRGMQGARRWNFSRLWQIMVFSPLRGERSSSKKVGPHALGGPKMVRKSITADEEAMARG